MKRKEKQFWVWVDILFKIFLFIAVVTAMKLVFYS